MTKLDPRHIHALRSAYERETNPLQRRYLREALNKVGVKINYNRNAPRVLSAFMAPLRPSVELAEIVGYAPISRTELVAKLWRYIKKYGLHVDGSRTIRCDHKMYAVFGKKEISMFELAGAISKHVS